MKNKTFKILVIAMVLVLWAALPAFGDETVSIRTPQELAAIKNNPSGSYILAEDIDMTGVDWVPFAFSGSLNGNGHTISNLSITKFGSERAETVDGNAKVYDTAFAALFSTVENATIEDLNITAMKVWVELQEASGDNMKGAYAASLAGYLADSTVNKCNISAEIQLKTNAMADGVGGLAGFTKAGTIENCNISTTLVLVDTDKEHRDENFLGGVYGAGYADINYCNINLDAYDSCHGYVHSGGMVGMYYPFGFAYEKAPMVHFDRNTVSGTINFFEDNKNRRAYCEATIGEIMNWNITRDGNKTTGFKANETKKVDVDLYPTSDVRDVNVKYTDFTTYKANSTVTLSAKGADTIVGVYMVFWDKPADYLIGNSSGTKMTIKSSDDVYLQRYIEVADQLNNPSSITVEFPETVKLCGAYMVTKNDIAACEGQLPDWVHNWDAPCEQADLVLLSSHADDEQLFFAGILPYYSQVEGLDVQVVYLTDHYGDLKRHQERLNGLWTVGIRHYPVSLGVTDAFSESYSAALANAKSTGLDEDALRSLLKDALVRFNPKVIVGHDEKGEYKHGQHILYTGLLEYLLDGTDLKDFTNLHRVYLHLYEENPIELSFLDTPCDQLGGKTPFQMTQDGFLCHNSQQWTWFKGWIFGKSTAITRAEQIATYSPLKYGLYYDRSTAELGDDTGAKLAASEGDFFAGLTSFRQDLEEAERLRKEAEEAERLRLEAEKAAAEEAERQRLEEELAQEQTRQNLKRNLLLSVIAAVVIVVGLSLALGKNTKKGKKKGRGKHTKH